MKKYLYKIIFPFYKPEKHAFLLGNVWFRALIVLSILAVPTSITGLWISKVNHVYQNCIQQSKKAYNLNEHNNNEITKIWKEMEIYSGCNNQARKAWIWPGILGDSILEPIIIFYILQFLFLSVGINFIYLGSKNYQKK